MADGERAERLGEIIRRQRELSALSMRQFADLVGISNPYLSQIERGLRDPSERVLEGIAKSLSVSVDALREQAGLHVDDEEETPRRRRGDPRRTRSSPAASARRCSRCTAAFTAPAGARRRVVSDGASAGAATDVSGARRQAASTAPGSPAPSPSPRARPAAPARGPRRAAPRVLQRRGHHDRPVVAQRLGAHEEPEVAAVRRSGEHVGRRCRDVVGQREDLRRRRDVVGRAGEHVHRTGDRVEATGAPSTVSVPPTSSFLTKRCSTSQR